VSDYVAHQPVPVLASQLTTFNDVVEGLLDAYGTERAQRNDRNAVRAVLEAYRDLPTLRDWHYYETRLPLATVAPVSEGTAAYDHTGSAAGERIVTLSASVVPTDVDLYTLKLGNVHYDVERRIDDTTFQLGERSNPGADVAATSYQLYKDTYVLPLDFQGAGVVLDQSNSGVPLAYSDADDAFWQARARSAQQPTTYTFRAAPRRHGAWAIQFSPIPAAARNYDLVFKRKPSPLTTQMNQTGTASVTSGSRSVTLAGGGAVSAKHVGCVMRFGTTAKRPLPPQKGFDDGVEALLERVVMSVTPTTALELDVAADADYAAVKFTLSSPIDVDPGAMLTFFTLLCEARLARLEGREDAERREGRAMSYLKVQAAAADNKARSAGIKTYAPRTLADVATSVTP
jgi:hypothetical protein